MWLDASHNENSGSALCSMTQNETISIDAKASWHAAVSDLSMASTRSWNENEIVETRGHLASLGQSTPRIQQERACFSEHHCLEDSDGIQSPQGRTLFWGLWFIAVEGVYHHQAKKLVLIRPPLPHQR